MGGESTRKPVGLYALTGIISMIAAVGFSGLTAIFTISSTPGQRRLLSAMIDQYGIQTLLLCCGVPLLLLGLLLIINGIKGYGGVLARISELAAGSAMILHALFILYLWFNYRDIFILIRLPLNVNRYLMTIIPNALNILLFWSILFYAICRILWVKSIPSLIIGLFTIAAGGLFCFGSLINFTSILPSTFYFIIGPTALFSLGVLILVTAIMRQNINI